MLPEAEARDVALRVGLSDEAAAREAADEALDDAIAEE